MIRSMGGGMRHEMPAGAGTTKSDDLERCKATNGVWGLRPQPPEASINAAGR
jgi:hypothetical protein